MVHATLPCQFRLHLEFISLKGWTNLNSLFCLIQFFITVEQVFEYFSVPQGKIMYLLIIPLNLPIFYTEEVLDDSPTQNKMGENHAYFFSLKYVNKKNNISL